MEPKIISKPAFTVVGMKYHGKPGDSEIPRLWGLFMPRMGEIKHLADPQTCYGLSDNMDMAIGEFDYIAAFEVTTTADIPEGMVSVALPAQSYAVFTCTLPVIGQTFQQIYSDWLPRSGYQRPPGPEFELYDVRFNPNDPSSPIDVYIPVSKA